MESNIFLNVSKYRDEFKKIFIDDILEFSQRPRNSLYTFPTIYCPNSCEHCYFSAPLPKDRSEKGRLSEETVDKIIKFTNENDFDKVVLSGGGEPLLEEEISLKLIGGVGSRGLLIHTSGVTLIGDNAFEKLRKLLVAAEENKSIEWFTLRISLDEFHLDKIPLDRIVNLIENYCEILKEGKYSKASLAVHSLYEDKSVPWLIKKLEKSKIKIKELVKDEVGNVTRIFLEDVPRIFVDYSDLFHPMFEPDMKNSEIVEKNLLAFEKGRVIRPFYSTAPVEKKGFCYCIYEDSSLELWNCAPSDNVIDFTKTTFEEAKEKIFSDVIYRYLIETDMRQVDEIISEVNPHAVLVAKVVNSATYYLKRATKNPKDLLYLSIRAIQEFISDGVYSVFFSEIKFQKN